MSPDREGFLSPAIDSDACIECGLCERSCPTQEDIVAPLFNDTSDTVDAAWEKDLDARLQSTSGGAFYVLAQKWIDSGGVVYGADFDENLNICHVCARDIESLKRLRGSKYVQSDVHGVYRDIKRNLNAGVKVMFSGTPCQVAGLRAFLKKDYENLITIDLVCHGTPSPMMFKEHRNYIEKSRGEKLTDYKFRGKEKSGWRAYIKYVFAGYKTEKKPLGKDFFAYCFYNSKFNRRSCFTCDFSQAKRVGDITLSDFWNVEISVKSLRIQRKYGFNMVMCNTKKGSNLYSLVKEKMGYIPVKSIIAINGDVRLRHAEAAPPDRDSIFDDYYAHGYDWLVENRNARKSFSNLIPEWVKNMIYEIKARI